MQTFNKWWSHLLENLISSPHLDKIILSSVSWLAGWGVYATKFIFFFQQHTHLQVKHEPPLVLIFSFFCLLPIHVAIWRPSLHLHPTACWRIWPDLTWLIGEMLRAVSNCGNACSVRLLFSFFSLLPLADLVLNTCLTATMHILCTFAENMSPCAKWGPPWIVGPYAQFVFCVEGDAMLQVIIIWWIKWYNSIITYDCYSLYCH